MSTMTMQPPVRQHLATSATYRLTRRGRLMVLTFGFIVVLALGLVFAGGSMASRDKEATQTMVVGSGDTLWDIASDVADGGDVRSMMSHIQQLNSLDGVSLVAGQHLRVPTG